MNRWLPLLLGLSVSGCSGLMPVSKDPENTVGELEPAEMPYIPPIEMSRTREKAMEQYRAFLTESPDNEHVPEALRRLADLQLTVEEEALTEGQMTAGSRSRAVELYQDLLTRFPDHDNSDDTLYQLARAYEQTGEVEPAMEVLSSYARSYQGGDKYDEAQFRRGEYLFVRRDYAGAEQAYLAVLHQGTESEFHRQALYKLGWARFKQSHYREALDAYVQLLDETIGTLDGSTLPQSTPAAEKERLDDTLRAVSISFSYLGGAGQIRDYFRQQGARSYEPLLYARLAALHLSKERYSDAAATYELFAASHPEHREAPLFRSRIIDVYKKAGFGKQVLAEKERFIELYEPGSSYWAKRKPAEHGELLQQVQRHLRDVARHYHAVAQQKATPAAYADAGRWYRLYLRSFPDSEQAPYMNFLYAELLTSAGRHDLAAVQYERTAYEYGDHEKAPEAGYAALLAYQKHEAALKGSDRDEWHRKGIDSAIRFADAFPAHREALAVRTRAAQQLYALGEQEAAIIQAQKVIGQKDAAADLQLSGWTVIAHANFDLGDYRKAELAYLQVLARSDPGDSERSRLRDNLAASIYKQGEQERAAGNMEGAAQHFLRIASVVPESSINVSAQYDAASAYIALKQWDKAIAILERWRKNNPGNKLQEDATRKLAVLYQENDQPLLAAGELVRIAATEKDPALRREAAWTAATLYRKAGHSREAIAAYEAFVSQFPQPVEQATEARYRLVQLYQQAGDAGKVRHWRQQIVKADREAGKQRTERTRFLAAHARLALVRPDALAYRNIALTEPLKTSLARKKKYMKAAIDGYREAAAYKVSAVTTRATYEIGRIYSDFGQALMASERPRNLNEEELEQYEILLEEQAYPFEEKAIEVHETNAERIAGGIYDEWVRKSMKALAELMPVRYGKEEKGEDFVAVLQ